MAAPVGVVLVLMSCGSQRDRTPAITEAFVGPVTLNLRQEVSTKSPVSAVVHHGEALDILEYRRRFVKVRTAGGIVGWTDIRQLMTPEQMADLKRLAERAASSPSQGLATAFEALNVHSEPNRISPSFFQIPEGGKVDVIGHKVAPRAQGLPPIPVPPPKPKLQRHRSKERASGRIPPLPMPPAPKPPANWLELSKPTLQADPPPAQPAVPAQPVHLDDWTLIRSKDGRTGWVLSRMLTMAIPDEVAQYAEGHRITSYFPMGDVRDGDLVKHNYLWTTIRTPNAQYEFDSWRFFVWSKHRHRYETAYIQRDVIGHYPVEVDTSGPEPMFALILEDDDGKLSRKTFAFNGYRVSLVDSVPYDPSVPPTPIRRPAIASNAPRGSAPMQSWYSGVKDRLTHMFHR